MRIPESLEAHLILQWPDIWRLSYNGAVTLGTEIKQEGRLYNTVIYRLMLSNPVLLLFQNTV